MLIPLAIILLYQKPVPETRPVIVYVYVALIINLAATIMFVFHSDMPSFLKNNNICYNIHSIVRVLFFSWYLHKLHLPKLQRLIKMATPLYIGFVLINFIFFESPFFISSLLFSAESIFILVLCLFYFFHSIQDDSETEWTGHPSFTISAGIGFFEAITFFIFLFYNPLYVENRKFGKLTFTIHNFTYVIFCIMLAIALYKYLRRFRDAGLKKLFPLSPANQHGKMTSGQ